MSIKQVLASIERTHKAERELEAAIKKEFPVDRQVVFKYGRATIVAEVIGHSANRVKVRNVYTEKERWIGVGFLLRDA